MRILLDENMPPRFRHYFPGLDVRSTQFMGWRGHRNGELLRLGRDLFDVIITQDQTLAIDARPTPEDVGIVILVPDAQGLPALVSLVPQILEVLQTIQLGQVKWVPPEADPGYIKALH